MSGGSWSVVAAPFVKTGSEGRRGEQCRGVRGTRQGPGDIEGVKVGKGARKEGGGSGDESFRRAEKEGKGMREREFGFTGWIKGWRESEIYGRA